MPRTVPRLLPCPAVAVPTVGKHPLYPTQAQLKTECVDAANICPIPVSTQAYAIWEHQCNAVEPRIQVHSGRLALDVVLPAQLKHCSRPSVLPERKLTQANAQAHVVPLIELNARHHAHRRLGAEHPGALHPVEPLALPHKGNQQE